MRCHYSISGTSDLRTCVLLRLEFWMPKDELPLCMYDLLQCSLEFGCLRLLNWTCFLQDKSFQPNLFRKTNLANVWKSHTRIGGLWALSDSISFLLTCGTMQMLS